jgi:hypothetical protein
MNRWNGLQPSNRVKYKNAEGIVVQIGLSGSTPFVVVELVTPIKGKKTFTGLSEIQKLTRI